MPIYGYVCSQCGHTQEVLQGINDPPLRECQVCLGPLRKQLYPVGVIFKGSGFYTTDYKNNTSGGGRSSTKSDSDGGGKSESKEAGGSAEKSGDSGAGKAADSAAS